LAFLFWGAEKVLLIHPAGQGEVGSQEISLQSPLGDGGAGGFMLAEVKLAPVSAVSCCLLKLE